MQAATTNNGKIYAVAGMDENGNNLQSVEMFDPVANAWTLIGNLMSPARSHASVAVLNGQLIVAGGSMGNALNSQDISQVESFPI